MLADVPLVATETLVIGPAPATDGGAADPSVVLSRRTDVSDVPAPIT
jgi:hypothetical protein